ncbi:MAG: diguanylate cyclase [Gammaproteobacteria bacterium]|nr:MAG: diguanylate cyclase [Gammaproteobacteria bacterium]
METPKITLSEDTRIETLKALKILDTPAEERFDRLTRIAREVFNVPTALVSLIDENRQWFKSSVGLEVSETPRDISFCGHAIHSDDIFIIRDAKRDIRFHDNPLVQGEPWIRFYAGYPLKAMNGERLGTFCIIDSKPRALNDKNAQTLIDLGCIAERELSMLHIATNDELTKIFNLRGFKMLAQNNLDVCIQHGFPASLIYFDIDNFKSINDEFGHARGDKLLISFTKMLKDSFRTCEVPARIGSDEFGLLLGNKDKNQAEDCIRVFQKLIDVYNNNVKEGYTIAFTHCTVEFDALKHSSIQAMINEGQDLIYEIKNRKNNVVQLHSSKIKIA